MVILCLPIQLYGHLCGCGAVSHLHHACTVFQGVQEESLLKRIMTTKYLMTDYIAGQHDPHRSAMWSLAAKPGCLWETVISGPWLLPAQLYIRAVLCQISLACPNKRATAATAEESEDDGSCCIASGRCPLASQSQQFSWMCRGACLWECIIPGPPPFPTCTHVCAGMRGHPPLPRGP